MNVSKCNCSKRAKESLFLQRGGGIARAPVYPPCLGIYAYSGLIDRAAGPRPRHIRRAFLGCAMANDDRPKALGRPVAHQGGWTALPRVPAPAAGRKHQHQRIERGNRA
ncbi:hypothetical protein JTE90_026124 [Oedothorax gibbosus]|uniref:Uncharacterized protein n=1 Tax=Oedothorax gibbosus TaxID=931172 RepID=A0AAV6V1S2_9ARAC|nr:hypothetical protein JTE90_026124 [Oedothorax gibbosus]